MADTYGSNIVVLLWMNDAMAMMMTATTPTKLRAWGEGGSNTTMSTTMRLGAGVNTTIRCMKSNGRRQTKMTTTRLRVGGNKTIQKSALVLHCAGGTAAMARDDIMAQRRNGTWLDGSRD